MSITNLITRESALVVARNSANLPDCPFDSIKNNSYYRSFSATVLSAPFSFVAQGVLNGLSGQGLIARLFTGSIFYCN